jgi:hypothetical protein
VSEFFDMLGPFAFLAPRLPLKYTEAMIQRGYFLKSFIANYAPLLADVNYFVWFWVRRYYQA